MLPIGLKWSCMILWQTATSFVGLLVVLAYICLCPFEHWRSFCKQPFQLHVFFSSFLLGISLVSWPQGFWWLYVWTCTYLCANFLIKKHATKSREGNKFRTLTFPTAEKMLKSKTPYIPLEIDTIWEPQGWCSSQSWFRFGVSTWVGTRQPPAFQPLRDPNCNDLMFVLKPLFVQHLPFLYLFVAI